MVPDSVDAKELDELLASFGWSDRIRTTFSRLLASIDEAAYRHPLAEIPLIKRRLTVLFGKMNLREPVSRDLLEAFSREFQAAAERLLKLSQDPRLFERTVEVESMVRLRFHDIQQERRESLRFPVALPARLLVQTTITPATLVNVSLTGVQFTVRQPLQNHIRYPFNFESSFLCSAHVTPVHQLRLSGSGVDKVRVGARIDPPLGWSEIRRTLVFLYQRD